MRPVSPADVGYGGDGDARLEAAAHRMVLGGLSDGHPLERPLRAADVAAAGPGLLQECLAFVRQAAPGHGQSARALLSGVVEIDETQVSYRTKDDPVTGGGGRSPDGKMQVAVAVEIIDEAPGRLRLGTIEDASSASLHPFIKANVAAGSTLKTDGWSAYPGVAGFKHEPHVVGAMAAHVVLPWVHRVISNLKTWALGVYHGLRRPHLQSYLDEFVFRFNRRRTPHAAFRTLLGITVAIEPATYNMLIAPEAQG